MCPRPGALILAPAGLRPRQRPPDAEHLPAPLGRGPTGWPLRPCEACGELIPWSKSHGKWLKLSAYLGRRWCSDRCRQLFRQWTRAGRSSGDSLSALGPPEIQGAVALHARDILTCSHCDGVQLEAIGPGKRCWDCGAIMYARLGDYTQEPGIGRPGRRVP